MTGGGKPEPDLDGPLVSRETMWAEMKPDCYGGESCDEIVPQWSTFADGDKEDDTTAGPIVLGPEHFPPGTLVVISEPACPKCGDPRYARHGEVGFVDQCDCGFDWVAWTLGQYG